MRKQRYLEAGQIVNTHGIKGEVRIVPWLDSPGELCRFPALYVDGKALKIRHARVHKGMVIAALEGVEDVNAAMELKGRTVHIDREDAKLPPGRFFLADLLGAKVVTEDGEELGILSDVMDLPAQRIYVVEGEREYLIPAVPEFIRQTDVDAGVVTVRLISGM